MKLHQHNSDKVYKKAGEFLINYLHLYHNITQKTLLLLSGGSTVELYKPLADLIRESDLEWKFLTVAQVDERFQPDNNVIASPQAGCQTSQPRLTVAWRSRYDSEQRRGLLRPSGPRNDNNSNINSILIGQTGLWEACDKKKIPYYLVSQESSFISSAKEYNNTLEKLFKENVYKIAVLGIGEDGHTAGLLPGYGKLWNTANLVAGYENTGKFPQRISITPKAIKMLDAAIVVANGEKKRGVIKHLTVNSKQETINKEKIVNNKELDKFPVRILTEIPQVDLFTDVFD